MWRLLTVHDAVSVGLLEGDVQLTPWSIQQVRETLEHGAVGWGAWDTTGLLFAYLVLQGVLDSADILTLGVHPARRRQGWGRQGLEQAQRWAVQHGVATLFLEVRVSNTSAVGLYTACGFQTHHHRAQYYSVLNQPGVREDAWIMVWQNSTIGTL